MNLRRSWLAPAGTVVAVLVVWGLVAAVHPSFNCNRWDNFEYFTPAILQAHNLWLGGELPALNPHQLMGDPLIPSGQPGVFYFPYTLSVLLLQALSLPAEQLTAIVWCLHLPWAALGFFLLMRSLGVRDVFSFLTALSVCFGGYVVSVSLCWIFMLAIFAWLPWILWGVVEVLSGARTRSGGVMLAVALAAVASVGYPQMTVYVWLLTLLFGLLYGFWVRRAPRRLLAVCGPLAAGALLSAPTLWPMALMMSHTSRAEAFSVAAFLERGVPWSMLLQWVCPVIEARTDFFRDRASLLGHQGPWIVAGLIAGLVVWRARERLGWTFAVLMGLAGVFTLLALGANGFIYPLTYGLPVWSSFRWPFKFFLLSQPLVVLAAGVGLELSVEALTQRRWARWVIISVPLGVALALGVSRTASWYAVAPAALVVMLVGWCDRTWCRAGLAVAGVLGAAAVLSQCHQPGLKTYRERYGETLGIDTSYRVLPLTPSYLPVLGEWRMQELGLFHAATVNGYFSATGTAAGLIPSWFVTCLPCKVDGTLPHRYATQLLPSHLLRTFNVKYVVAGAGDGVAQGLVREAGGYRLVRRSQHGLVYENQDALPRAYFATEVHPFSLDALRTGLLLNQAPLTTAYVEQWSRSTRMAPARVLQADYGQAEATFAIDAPRGGWLVFSQRYDPGWRALVDGEPVPVRQANLTLMGVSVPAGATRVSFRYTPPGLWPGLGLAAAGALLLGIWLRANANQELLNHSTSSRTPKPVAPLPK